VLLTLALPRINEHMTTAVIAAIHASAGAPVVPGAMFADVTVDLSATAEQDCPPISYYRIVLRDRAWLRVLHVARGDEVAAGASLALFSTDPGEALDAAPARAIRTTIAGILAPVAGWGGR
jgi:hypothetical protein